MNGNTEYIGLDVSKERIAVADEGRTKARYVGIISYTVGAIRKLIKKLVEPEELRVCYGSWTNWIWTMSSCISFACIQLSNVGIFV